MYDARQRIVGGCHTISEVLDEVPGINGFAIFVDEKVCVCVCVCVGECGGMRVRLYLDCWMWMKAMHVRQVVHCLCLVKNKF